MSSIKLTPLWTSLCHARRTVGVYTCIVTFMYGPLVCPVFIVSLFFTRFYLVSLLYLLWFAYDRNTCNKGGRRIKVFRRLKCWEYLHKYFPLTMIKTAELDPTKNYIFCLHPHGVFNISIFGCFGTEATNFSQKYPGLVPRMLVLEHIVWNPLFREIGLSIGLCAATPASIEWLLTKEGTGNALGLTIGGAREALDAHPGTATLTLKRRKGFVKLALKHGASLIPVFSFGENDIFRQVKNPEGSLIRRIQNKFTETFRFAIPLFYGKGFTSCPFQKPITVVIGKPIHLEKIPEPTEKDIDVIHQMYVDRLVELFEEHREKYAPDVCLKVI